MRLCNARPKKVNSALIYIWAELPKSLEERALAVKAAKVMGLDVAGVDIVRSGHGPLVLEVNSSPGLKGIETATGKDVAGAIIAYIEKDAQKGPNNLTGKG